MIKALSLLFSAFAFQIHAYTYDLAILAMFQNEAKYLPEWIEFHQRQGVEHFYLYNNNSTDNYLQVLKPYILAKQVDLIDWPSSGDEFYGLQSFQSKAYNHCIEKIRSEVMWLAVLDIDEFLFNPYFIDLRDILSFYRSYPGVIAHWVMYGSSHVEKIPQGERIVDHLVYRASSGHNHCKSIVRPKYVDHFVNPHCAVYKEGKEAVNENKKIIHLSDYCTDKCQFTASILRINHYWSKDLDFFYNVKIARRQKWGQDCETIIQWESEMNQVYDPILKGR